MRQIARGKLQRKTPRQRPQKMLDDRALPHELLQLRGRIGARADRLVEIEIRREAALGATAHDVEVLLARLECLARGGDLRVERAQRKVASAP